MAAKNDITGDELVSRAFSKKGQEQFDIIFGVKKKERWIPPPLPNLNEYPDNSTDEWDESRIDTIGMNGNDGLHYEQI